MLQDQSRNRTPMPAAQPPAGAAPSEPGPARAEAGVARMLAGAPSSASTQTRAAPDPVHALIAEHRAAYAEWDRLSAIPNNMLRSDPGFDAAEAAAAGPGRRESTLLDALVAARPTSLAGIAALAEYLPGALRQVDPDEQEPDGEVALRNIAAALHALTAPMTPDPIFAALATYREAAAAMDAFSDWIRDRRPTAKEFAEENRLSAEQCRLRDSVLATVPTTAAGRAALVQLVRDEIAASGMADGGPPDDGHPIWRDGLRALMAAQEAEICVAAAPSHLGASPALVAMVEQWQALLDRINGEGVTDAEAEALGGVHCDLQVAIYDFPAASIADLLAKVTIFKDELYDAIGGLDDSSEPAKTLAGAAWLGLFRDFERLAAIVPPRPALTDAAPVAAPLSPASDAAILALVAQFKAADRARDDADTALGAAYEASAASEPPRPDALRRAGDFHHFSGGADNIDSPEFYTGEDVRRLRTMTCFGHYQQRGTDAALARAAEIGAAWDEWLALSEANDAAHEVPEREARWQAADTVCQDLASEILALRPKTLAGLTAKARLWKYAGQVAIAEAIRTDLMALDGAESLPCLDPPLSGQIIACWREWAALTDFSDTEQGLAANARLEAERSALCAAAEALPVSLGNVPAKALALAWLGYSDLWHNEWPRDRYATDGRLALDIDTAICGRLKTHYSGEAV